ncbi:MAG TPA: cell division protein ZapE [Stellaceae bacterium]|jgi:cell division protein ZapE|nr:cell division protein ZapE [Stellaceae bacterium]
MQVDTAASGQSLSRAAADPDAAGAGPAELYREQAASGRIRTDPAQQRAVMRLQQLHEALVGYHPAAKRGWLSRLGLAAQAAAPPRGLYIWGPVGRGKSMLMDLFFSTAPVVHKRRVHFHAFMLDVHARFETERRSRTLEPVAKVAADLAADATLLCFDEFQVNDIADAMIIERLFRALFDAGTVIVATSNRAPDRLYENGLQRDRFLPFIALLQETLNIAELDSGRDYRLARLMGKPIYHTPLDAAAHQALAAAFAELTENAEPGRETLTIMKRELMVPRAAHNTAWFGFEELCARPLSAADYLAIAERYAAVIVEGIPRIGPKQRNEAQRFHILIDTLYEARTLFIASAAVPPDQIYVAGDGVFEFQRTVSRLMEMQSEDYIANRAAGAI